MTDQAQPGRFRGYAAIFDVPDKGRDIIRPGAFASTLESDVPLLWQHDVREPIGRILRMREDSRGLMVEARLSLECQRGRDAWALMRDGALSGLSIGYRARDARPLPRRALRELNALELIEVSLVTLPMQPLARVTMFN
jgi:uncharacterized protein